MDERDAPWLPPTRADRHSTYDKPITLEPKQAPDEQLLALQQAIQRPPGVIDDDRHSPAVHSAPEPDSLRTEALGTLGRAFSIDARETNAFSKLARYESNIERALFRALRELQSLQSARPHDHEADIAPPVAPNRSNRLTRQTRTRPRSRCWVIRS
jgi:hypothetical protein